MARTHFTHKFKLLSSSCGLTVLTHSHSANELHLGGAGCRREKGSAAGSRPTATAEPEGCLRRQPRERPGRHRRCLLGALQGARAQGTLLGRSCHVLVFAPLLKCPDKNKE